MILTQEQKEILIKDICCRLPYGVKIQTDYTDIKILEGIQFPNYIGISDKCGHEAFLTYDPDEPCILY